MALYSFAVKKKGTNKYFQAKGRHELPFLDFFAMRFNNKRELMKFLGADLKKYDDVVIGYQNKGKLQILPIYFDAKELDQVAGLMVDFSKFDYCENIYEILAASYMNPDKLIFKSIPEVKTFDDITRVGLNTGFTSDSLNVEVEIETTIFSIEKLLYMFGRKVSPSEKAKIREKCNRIRNLVGKLEPNAVRYESVKLSEFANELQTRLYGELGKRFGITSERVRQVEAKLNEEAERKRFIAYEIELRRSYLVFRRGYTRLREEGLLSGEIERKRVPNVTMQELYQKVEERKESKAMLTKKSPIVALYKAFGIDLVPAEEEILTRCVSEDAVVADGAYNELMGINAKRLKKLKPIFDKYVKEVRGKQKKIGTMPGTAR